jgi:hypothetical protein
MLRHENPVFFNGCVKERDHMPEHAMELPLPTSKRIIKDSYGKKKKRLSL